MYYILRPDNLQVTHNCIRHIRELPDNQTFIVDIKPYKKSRTRQQNRCLWAFYREISKHTGHTEEELHESVKVRVLGVEEVDLPYTQQKVLRPKSSAKLKVGEMVEFINAVEALASELGVRLQKPDDYDYVMGC